MDQEVVDELARAGIDTTMQEHVPVIPLQFSEDGKLVQPDVEVVVQNGKQLAMCHSRASPSSSAALRFHPASPRVATSVCAWPARSRTWISCRSSKGIITPFSPRLASLIAASIMLSVPSWTGQIFRNHQVTPCPWPEGVPAGNFGPQLTATIGLLAGYRLSTRTVAEVARDLFQVSISLGSVGSCEQTVSRAVAPAVEEARAYVKKQPVGNADETSWREGRRKAWLWIFATTFVIVFLIHRRRNREAARELLGSFKGTLGSDRWAPYRVHGGSRQICWSHLARDFAAMSEYKCKAGRIGKELLRQTHRMFRWWHRVRDGTMTRSRFKLKMKPLQRRVEDLLRQGVESCAPRVAGMCWDIGGIHADALWTFVEVEGVEPTNNRAERWLRHAVLWRKSSFGTHSEAGSRFVERMLTVRATLRAQERNVVQFVTQAVHASLNRLPLPSLLPEAGIDGPASALAAAA